jgi:hypothetical protein
MSELKNAERFTKEVIPGDYTELNGPGLVQNPGIANYTAYTIRNLPKQGIALPQ